MKRLLQITFFAFLFLFYLLISPTPSFAATATWTNGGADGLWSTCANWAGGTGTDGCPGTSDVATFNSTSIDNVSIDTDVTVAGISIATGYNGEISQNSTRTITVGLSNFTQEAGTFVGGDSTIDINGNLSIAGGVFTSTSSTLNIERSLTISEASFTHNFGTVNFDGGYSSNSSIDADGIDFNLVIINRSYTDDASWGQTLTIASGTTIPLGDSPSITLINNSTRCCGDHLYNLVNNGNITVGTGLLTANINGNFTNNGTLAMGTGTDALTTNIGGTLTNNGTITGSNTSWILNGNFTNSSTGILTMSSATTFDINTYNAYYIAIPGNFINNAGSTFTSVVSPTFNVSGSFIIDSASTFPANVSLTLDGNSGSNSTVDALGYIFSTPVTINRSFTYDDSWGQTLTIASGTTIPLGDAPSITLINNSTKCCGDHPYNLVNNGTLSFDTTGTLTTNINGTFTNNGTIIGSNSAWIINGDFTNSSTGTLSMSSATHFDVNAENNYYNANTGTFRNDASSIFTSAVNPTFNINGSFIVDSSSTFPSNATLIMDGNAPVHTSINAPEYIFATPVTINRMFSDGTVWSQNLTIESGTTIPLGDSPSITLTNTSTKCCGAHRYNLINNGVITIGTGLFTTNINGSFTNNGTISGSNTAWTINGYFVNASTGTVTMFSANTFSINSYYNYYNDNSGNLTNNSGATFTSASNPTISSFGDITIDASSTFPTTLGGVTLSGTSGTQTISMPNVTNFGVFTKNGGSTFTPTYDMSISDLNFSSGTIGNPSSPYIITLSGNFNQSSTGSLGGTNLTLSFSNSEVQTISKTSGVFSSVFQVNKTGGSAKITSSSFEVTAQTCDVIEGTFDINGKTFICGGTFTIQDGGNIQMIGSESPTTPVLDYNSTVTYTGNGDSVVDTYNIKDWSFSNLVINFSDNQDILDSLGVSHLVVHKNLTIAQGLFIAPSSLTIGGNFTNNGNFTAGTGTVTFNGSNQNIGGTSTSTFFGLVITGTSARTVTIQGGTTLAIATNGSLIFRGASNNLLTLESSDSTDWNLQVSPIGTTVDVSYVSVSHSNASDFKEIDASHGTNTNGGNNSNWIFSTVFVPTSLGPPSLVNGSYISNNQPTFSFSLSSSDSSATIKYNIQIDDTSDFSSPEICYTSELETQGSQSFTVGQTEGGGTYAVGLAEQILTDRNYYWRVLAIDSNDVSGSYALANTGEVAFIVDTISPSAPGTPSTNPITNTTSQTWSWSPSTDTGSGVANYAWRVVASSSETVANGTTSSLLVETNLTEGVYDFLVKAIDNVGNQGNESSASLTVDTTSPLTTNSRIDPSWQNTNFTITFSCSDNSSGCSKTYYTTDASTPTLLSSTGTSVVLSKDGIHTIKYLSVDNAGNQETSKTAPNKIKIDKTKPSNGSISIDKGSLITTTRSVNLAISASDSISGIYQMIISEDSSFLGALWESYSTSEDFSLSGGDGVKTVYIKFKDSAGNVSDTYSDSITLKTAVTEDPISEEIEEQVEDEEQNETEEVIQEEKEETRGIKLVDKDDNPLVGATVEIDGNTYTTDSNGQISIENLDNSNYKVKITYNGKEYTRDIESLSSQRHSIEIQLDIKKDVDWIRILLMYLTPGLLLLVTILILFKKRVK